MGRAALETDRGFESEGAVEQEVSAAGLAALRRLAGVVIQQPTGKHARRKRPFQRPLMRAFGANSLTSDGRMSGVWKAGFLGRFCHRNEHIALYNECVTACHDDTYDNTAMTQLFHPLLALIASAIAKELARYVDYLEE